jgi:hypothetical protein
MSDPINTDQGGKSVARILSTKVNIPLYKGNVPDSISIDVFLDNLENFYVTEGITEDCLMIAEMKRYIHPTQGDAFLIVSSQLFKGIVKWIDFKKKLLDIFQTKAEYDTLFAMNSLFQLKQGKESFQSFVARVANQVHVIKVSAESNYKLNIDDSMLNLLALSTIEKEIPLNLKTKFKNGINLQRDIWSQLEVIFKIMQQDVKKVTFANVVKDDVNDVGASSDVSSTDSDEIFNVSHNKNRNFDKNVMKQNHNIKNNDYSVKRNFRDVVCYNCHQAGHVATFCRNKPYCNICHKNGHNSRFCYFNDRNSQSHKQNFHQRKYHENIK